MYRFDIINHLIQRYDYQRYLEIGVETGEAFNNVQCAVKHGVDPFSDNATFRIPSDEFFAMIHDDVEYDIIFVDGLHVEDQTQRDIENALLHLSDGGTIVVHDCNPPTEWHQRSYEDFLQKYSDWNGTTWRGFVNLRATRPDIEMCVVDTDWGCGIIRLDGEGQDVIDLPDNYSYTDFHARREEWLNLIPVEAFLQTLA
ncbi:MAG: class I SAM-dependent methyltransferase [Methylococcales bacterium]|nr:class I SAM-dependent methyltransferase [Methylococcales bacterium]